MKYDITLTSGTVIEDCQKKLGEFCQKDASYRRYDLPPDVREDNELVEREIQFANRMVARMGPLIIKSVVSRTKTINSALARIATGTSICDKSVPWSALEQLFSATLGPEIGAARATKILHKKRPAFIPILDSVVLSYCKAVCSSDLRGENEASRMTAYVKAIKIDIDNNLDVLESIIQASAVKVTPVRAFDIILWGYSGEYETTFGRPPVWKR